MRKRDKQIAAEGQAPRIDMETLRASARAADLDKSHSRAQAQSSNSHAPQSQMSNTATPPLDNGNQSHHQGSFQVVNMGPGHPPSATSTHAPAHPQQPMGPSNGAPIPVPQPPWSGHGAHKGRGYAPGADQLQQSSFMRTSQHSGSSNASPR